MTTGIVCILNYSCFKLALVQQDFNTHLFCVYNIQSEEKLCVVCVHVYVYNYMDGLQKTCTLRSPPHESLLLNALQDTTEVRELHKQLGPVPLPP